MENNIGALWIKEGTKGEFYKGYITLDNGEKVNMVIFRNNYKNKENQPDFNILKSKNNKDKQYEQEEREAIQNESSYNLLEDESLPF